MMMTMKKMKQNKKGWSVRLMNCDSQLKKVDRAEAQTHEQRRMGQGQKIQYTHIHRRALLEATESSNIGTNKKEKEVDEDGKY